MRGIDAESRASLVRRSNGGNGAVVRKASGCVLQRAPGGAGRPAGESGRGIAVVPSPWLLHPVRWRDGCFREKLPSRRTCRCGSLRPMRDIRRRDQRNSRAACIRSSTSLHRATRPHYGHGSEPEVSRLTFLFLFKKRILSWGEP